MEREEIKSVSIKTEPVVIQTLTVVQSKHAKQIRATYTYNNALLFKSAFDRIIASEYKDHEFVSYDSLCVTPHTLYIKILDALKWWVNDEDKEGGPYYKLRQLYIFKRDFVFRGQKGILLKRNLKTINQVNFSKVHNGKSIFSIRVTDLDLDNKLVPSTERDGGDAIIDSHWRQAVIEIFENGAYAKNFDMELAEPLNQEDKEWIDNLFAGAKNFGIEYMIDGKKITIRKEKL